MNIKLNVLERVTLLSILPKETDFITLRVLQDLRSNLGLTEKELIEYEVKTTEGKIVWNAKGAQERDFEIGEKSREIILTEMKELDKQKKVTAALFPLFEKFKFEE